MTCLESTPKTLKNNGRGKNAKRKYRELKMNPKQNYSVAKQDNFINCKFYVHVLKEKIR